MLKQQGTQISVESVFISSFTVNNIAQELQKCWTHKIAFKIISKTLKQSIFLQSAFNTSEGRTFKVLPLYDFWFKLYDRSCSPNPIVDLLPIFNHQNRKP